MCVCVCKGWSSGYLPQSSAAVSLKPDIRPWCVFRWQSCHVNERGAGRQSIVPLGLQSHFAVRQRTWSRISRDTVSPRRGIQRGRQTVPTEIPATGDCLRAQPVVCANISEQGSAPRPVGPCGPQCFSTNSAGSQIQCLGLGAWAEQTADVPGAQTVSTTQIRTAGNCVGKRRQSGRREAPWSNVSLCLSRVRAAGASACECCI